MARSREFIQRVRHTASGDLNGNSSDSRRACDLRLWQSRARGVKVFARARIRVRPRERGKIRRKERIGKEGGEGRGDGGEEGGGKGRGGTGPPRARRLRSIGTNCRKESCEFVDIVSPRFVAG